MQITTIALGLAVRETATGEVQVLLSQRWQPDRPEVHLHWQFVGGAVEAGEDSWEALVREFEEEIACTPDPISQTPLVATHRWDQSNSTREKPHALEMEIFAVNIGEQTPRANQEEETHDVRWFSADTVPKENSLPQTPELVRALLSREGLI